MTDADGDAAQLTFTITVSEDLSPTFGAQTIGDKSWVQRKAIDSFTLPAASGGDGALTYTLSPALPDGVSRHATTQVVSGTPGDHQVETTYTWRATDADGDAAQLTFTITVAEDLSPTFGAQTIGDKSWVQRKEISSFTLPAASGGDGTLTYTLSPALPDGVSRHATTRVVSGTPGDHQAEMTYTWRATDADGDAAQLTFTITVSEDLSPSFGAQTIGDKSWVQRKAINSFTLPAASGGDGTLTYTLSPALPDGVSRHATTRVVSGTPGDHQVETTYTWKATDADGDAAELTFTITVSEDLSPSFGVQTIGDKSWVQRKAIGSFTLPAASGGDGTLTYTLSPALPDGVSHATTTPFTVSGTPSVGMSSTEYTWTATDGDGDKASLTFDIEVDGVPSFGSQSIGNKYFTQDREITPFVLPAASGGDGALTYTLSPELPRGVIRATTTPFRVRGTPTTDKTLTEYTWTVTDADGDTAKIEFHLSVTAAVVILPALPPSEGTTGPRLTLPSFSETIEDQSWIQNQGIAPFVLPKASGGDGMLAYTLHPALPDGVDWTTTTASQIRVSGTPVVVMPRTEYTWKVMDADGDTAELTFTIEVIVRVSAPGNSLPSFGSQTIGDKSWVQRQEIDSFTLPAASGGDGTLTYTLSPGLPDGVSRHPTTRVVSGAPSVGMDSTTYTWKATDADGDVAELTFTIEVIVRVSAPGNSLPSFGSQTIGDKSWVQRREIDSFTLPSASGGDGELTYTLSPALPTGVTWNLTTREVGGTPSIAKARTEYRWAVEDAVGNTASLTFDISVDGVPTFGLQTISDKNWTQRQQISPFTLPLASGGDGTLTYTLAPALPAGVIRATTTPYRVSGTPRVRTERTVYTWTAMDENGSAAALTFSVIVSAIASPPPPLPPPLPPIIFAPPPPPPPPPLAEPTPTPLPAAPGSIFLPTATPIPTPTPTAIPTATPIPTPVPTAIPTATPVPTPAPTAIPTATPVPTPAPTAAPAPVPTATPTATPTPAADRLPSSIPAREPAAIPARVPADTPTPTPTAAPTYTPTTVPTYMPTTVPTYTPTTVPTHTATPTHTPTAAPTYTPTYTPTPMPTHTPTPNGAGLVARAVSDDPDTPEPTATPIPLSPSTSGGGGASAAAWLLLLIAILVVAIVGYLKIRRRLAS